MFVLRISRVKEELGGCLSLPLSVTDYINQKKSSARAERAIGMLMLRDALADLGITDYEIELSPFGKPYLKGKGPFFNISHSQGLCALALADRNVGIDLQALASVKKIQDKDRFAKRFFASDEYEIYKEEPTDRMLCKLWTRKEALAKMLDRPLSSSLSSLSSVSFKEASFSTWHSPIDGEYFLTAVLDGKSSQFI